MANGKSASLELVLRKLGQMDGRLKRMEERFSSEVELELVARKIADEAAEMKAKGRAYLTEAQVKKKYGF